MNNKYILGGIFVVAVAGLVVGLSYFGVKSANKTETTYDAFAQCLASKKLTMYGAEWCPHCQVEKARFLGAFKYVPYVECPENTKLCIDKGIAGYPTWITEDGKKYEGEQGLEKLAQISGCALPEVKKN